MNAYLTDLADREDGRQSCIEFPDAWMEATSASPRDHLEFGAKLLGFCAEVGGSPERSDRIAPIIPQAAADQSAPGPYPAIHSAVTLETNHVCRGIKFGGPVRGFRHRKVEPPTDSIEWQRLILKRIGFLSATFSATVVAAWLIWIVPLLPRSELDWMSAVAPIALVLLAAYGLLFLVTDAVYGALSGATMRARKYMDQVYPPGKKRIL